MIKYRDSAFKHGFNQEDAEDALSDPLGGWYELEPSKRGNPRIMIVGNIPGTDKYLEISLEIEGDDEWCYHIMKARAKSMKEAGIT